MGALLSRVCIAGAGVMGTSLGLALRRQGLAAHVLGWDREPERMEAALAAGAFDEVSAFPQDAVAGADLLIAAVPSDQVGEVARRYGSRLPAGAIFMDLSRIKRPVVGGCLLMLPASVAYVSADPHVRVQAPAPDVFEGALCTLSPLDDPPTAAGRDATERLTRLWSALGAEVRVMSADAHDLTRAAYLDLPRLLAAARITTFTELAEFYTGLEGLGGADFEAMAAALPEPAQVVADLDANREAVLSVLPRMISVLEDLKGWLELRAMDRVETLCQEARRERGRFVRHRPGAGPEVVEEERGEQPASVEESTRDD